MTVHTAYNTTLPALIGPQPNRWLWKHTDGDLYTMVVTKVNDHSDKINLVWWDDDNAQHSVIDGRHISKVAAGEAGWVETDGNTGYGPTS